MDSVTTFDKLLALYEAKKKTVEEGFKEFQVRYTAHFSHWFPWGGMIYDRFFLEKPPQDPAKRFSCTTGSGRRRSGPPWLRGRS